MWRKFRERRIAAAAREEAVEGSSDTRIEAARGDDRKGK
jgi:hypothetical protein